MVPEPAVTADNPRTSSRLDLRAIAQNRGTLDNRTTTSDTGPTALDNPRRSNTIDLRGISQTATTVETSADISHSTRPPSRAASTSGRATPRRSSSVDLRGLTENTPPVDIDTAITVLTRPPSRAASASARATPRRSSSVDLRGISTSRQRSHSVDAPRENARRSNMIDPRADLLLPTINEDQDQHMADVHTSSTPDDLNAFPSLRLRSSSPPARQIIDTDDVSMPETHDGAIPVFSHFHSISLISHMSAIVQNTQQRPNPSRVSKRSQSTVNISPGQSPFSLYLDLLPFIYRYIILFPYLQHVSLSLDAPDKKKSRITPRPSPASGDSDEEEIGHVALPPRAGRK
jgi:hypothetical protein